MDSIKSRGRHYISAILLVLVGVWFDQFTKTLAVDHLKGQDPFILFKNVFHYHLAIVLILAVLLVRGFIRMYEVINVRMKNKAVQ